MQKIINVSNGVTRMPEWRMAEPVNFCSCQGEHIAIVGPNGGGKTMLVDIITGKHPLLMHDPDYDFSPSEKTMVSDNIKYITFRDSYVQMIISIICNKGGINKRLTRRHLQLVLF